MINEQKVDLWKDKPTDRWMDMGKGSSLHVSDLFLICFWPLRDAYSIFKRSTKAATTTTTTSTTSTTTATTATTATTTTTSR